MTDVQTLIKYLRQPNCEKKRRVEAAALLATAVGLLGKLRYARPVGTDDPIWDDLSAFLANQQPWTVASAVDA